MNKTGKKGIIRSAALSAILITNTLLAGGEEETWTPRNTFQGFRYVEISANGDIVIKGAKGLVYTSASAGEATRSSSSRRRCIIFDVFFRGIANENRSLRPDADENTMSVGFPGLPVILPILTEEGHADTAYGLLYQNGMPSFMYAVEQGATTLWEKWDSYTAESGFDSSLLNSFNHVVNGSFGEWMYSHMAGIAPGENGEGFSSFILQPTPDPTGRMKALEASYESLWGTIRTAWTAEEGTLKTFTCTVPANTSARLYLPMEAAETPEGAEYTGEEMHCGTMCAVYELGSGVFSFS